MTVLATMQKIRKGGKRVLVALLASAACALGTPAPSLATIDNTVVASGTIGSRPVSVSATEQVDVINQIASVILDKTGTFNDTNGNTTADVGETITYNFAVTNTGNVTLVNVLLSDTKAAPGNFTIVPVDDVVPVGDSSDTPAAGWGTLSPGDTIRATATYTLTQADVDAGQVVNTASVTSTTIPGLTVSASDSVTTPLTTVSSMSLAKSGTLNMVDGIADVGDVITYQLVVTNTGPTTLRNVSINDPMLLASAGPETNPLQDLIQLATLPSDPITTASIPAEADVSAREPADWHQSVPQLPASFHATPKLVRMFDGNEALKAGDRIGVYFDIINTGDVPLVNINVTQPGSDAFGSAIELLAPNTKDSASIIFTRVLTQQDIDAGQIAFVTGITANARGKTIVQTLRKPMALVDVQTTDEIATASITPTNVATVAPGGQAIFTGTYAITQADIDAGQVVNNAEALATNTQNVTINALASATVPVPQTPAIAIEKTGALALGPDNIATPGDIITYSFTITNVGNTTLYNVLLADPLPGLTTNFSSFSNFAPNDTRNFTGTYALTQADIDLGRVENQATASGVPVGGSTPVSSMSDDPATPALNDRTVILIPAAPAIALIKEVANVADTNTSGMTDVGDTVTYRFRVRNTGNVPLNNVYVQDRNPAIIESPVPPTGITLAAGAEDLTSFTATYVLTQADADRGYFDNTADAFGTAPDNTIVRDESDPAVYLQNAPTRLTIPAVPALAVLKAQPTLVDSNSNGFTDAGDLMNYQIRVQNTGNVTLTNVTVTDPNAGNFSTVIPVLAPGTANAVTLSASHTVTLADVLAGSVSNQAFASTNYRGTPLNDASDELNLTQNNPTVTAIVPYPAIALIKPQPDIIDNGNGVTDAGDQLVYTFRVTNVGNVPLNTITITDPLGTVPQTRTTPLAVGETDSTTFSLTYTLTAADITAGRVTNQAFVSALSPTNAPTSDNSDNDSLTQNDPTVTLLAGLLDPSIALIKAATVADLNNNGVNDLGDRIDYTFTVTNTGNTNLSNVTVTDARLASEGVSLQPGNGVIGTMPRNGSPVVLTASHVIVQADVDAGLYDNQATVTSNLGTRVVTDLSDDNDNAGNDRTVVALAQTPAIAVIKGQPTVDDVNGNGFTDPDDILTYTFEIHNTGNVTLFNIALTDNNADQVLGGPIASLAPGAVDSTTYTATRLVTEDDARNGEIENSATVSASQTNGGALTVTDISDSSSLAGNAPTVTPIVRVLPVLTKTANRTKVRRGETVEYTITATTLGRGPYDVADIMPPGFQYVAGSATVNGAAATPAQSGNVLTFANITPVVPARQITVKLKLRAATANATGDFINKARLYLNRTGELLADAQARVTITEEHVFDCGEIIGRVFDDVNNNGYMDDGEKGLPGVRVVTVNGLLVTTDKFGRFHVTCADVPNELIGSNFIMKLDTRTLPAGYQLTTENPRDVRLTRGKITKLNFGVSKRRDIELDLTKDAFTGGIELKPKYLSGIDRLLALLEKGRGGLTITYRCGVYAPIADERLEAVEDLIQARWTEEGGNKPLKIKTRVECGK
jgi:uncharacterized repeat protein (TIGR01451 family)